MAAPKKNTYWLLAKNFVKPKSYQPDEMWLIAVDYFEWNGKNPLKEKKVFGSGYSAIVDKMRAMSVSAFCTYAGINRDTFNEYEKQEHYSDVCKRIKQIIYQQKFEGAAADLLNPSIIAWEIGLADKTEVHGNLEINWKEEKIYAPES